MKDLNKQAMVSKEELEDAIRIQNILPKIAREIVVSRELNKYEIDEAERDRAVDEFLKKQKVGNEEELNNFKTMNNLNDELIKKLACRPTQLDRFREEKWGPLATSLYLKNKETYDNAEYHQISSKDEFIMQEVYFRIKDNEHTWEDISKIFHPQKGESGSRRGPVRISSLNKTIAETIRVNNGKQPSKPIRIYDKVYIIQKIRIEAPKFDSELRKIVIKDAYDEWLNKEAAELIKNL